MLSPHLGGQIHLSFSAGPVVSSKDLQEALCLPSPKLNLGLKNLEHNILRGLRGRCMQIDLFAWFWSGTVWFSAMGWENQDEKISAVVTGSPFGFE